MPIPFDRQMFQSSYNRGADSYTARRKQEMEFEEERKKQQAQFLLEILKNNPGAYQPEEINRSYQGVQGGEGFNLPTERQGEPIRLGGKPKNSDPNEVIEINDNMSLITGLEPGTKVPRWQLEKLFAPQKRAETIAEGKENLQKNTQNFQADQKEKDRQAATERDAVRQKQAEINTFMRDMRKIIASPNSADDQVSMAAKALESVAETGEIPTFTTEEQKFLGIIPTGTKVNVQPVRSFNSIEEAEAANLPSGTIISIGGRKAKVK